MTGRLAEKAYYILLLLMSALYKQLNVAVLHGGIYIIVVGKLAGTLSFDFQLVQKKSAALAQLRWCVLECCCKLFLDSLVSYGS